MRHVRFQILSTFAMTVALFFSSWAWAEGAVSKLSNFKGPEVVEFQLVQPIGDDGYPRYATTDSKGPIGEVSMSVRCEEGYHWEEKNKKRVPYAWNYHELFVLDSSGPSTARQDAAARGQFEQGYHFSFKQSECAKEPANAGSGACTIQAELKIETVANEKTGASVIKPSAKILKWTCKDTKSPSGVSGGPSQKSPGTAP